MPSTEYYLREIFHLIEARDLFALDGTNEKLHGASISRIVGTKKKKVVEKHNFFKTQPTSVHLPETDSQTSTKKNSRFNHTRSQILTTWIPI